MTLHKDSTPLPFSSAFLPSSPHLPYKGIAIIQHLLRNLNTIWHLWLNICNTSKKRLYNLLPALFARLTDGLHLHLSFLVGLLLGLLVATGVLDGVSTFALSRCAPLRHSQVFVTNWLNDAEKGYVDRGVRRTCASNSLNSASFCFL